MATKLKETKLTAKSSHKRIITEWTKRLRSRKYKQTTGQLHRKDNETGKHEFCCLGVLCEMAVEAGVIPAADNGTGVYLTTYNYGGDVCVLPTPVRDWAGLQETDGTFTKKKDKVTSLANENDSGKKFGKIANIIESRPTGLFVRSIMTELKRTSEASTVRKVWTEALVSGDYKQGNIFLRQVSTHGEEFCCLGVLCDLAQRAGVISEPVAVLPSVTSPSLTARTYQYGTDTNQNFHIPYAVKEWAGIVDGPGDFFLADLEELNDTGKSFKAIAKMITEENKAFESEVG